MPSLPLLLECYFSPLGHQILQEGAWLLLIQTTLNLLGTLLLGITQWLMTKDFQNVLNTTTQLFIQTVNIKHVSCMVGIWGCLLWGAFRVLNREQMLLQLTTLPLMLLILSSAIIVAMTVVIMAPTIRFNNWTDTKAQEGLIQHASNPYIDAQFDFDNLTPLAKRSFKLVSVMGLLVGVLSVSFSLTRFVALSQGMLQTGYVLLFI